ncbi:hypothetical protein D3C78_1265090 [compost metagenome]
MRRCLRPGLDGKIGFHAVGIHAELLASLQHRLIDTAILILWDDADMCSDYTSSEFNRKIEDSFGLFDLIAISGGVLKAVSPQISAKC